MRDKRGQTARAGALRMAAVLSVTVVVLASAACSSTSSNSTASSAPPPAVGVVADSGFRPGPNGFTFPNYGTTLPDGTDPTNLTPADVRALFGDAVCVNAASGTCDLIPEAKAWMDQTNEQMAAGHCYGFSVAADIAWHNQANTSAFGAPTINGLSIDNNELVQSTIARGWTYQILDSVQNQKITGSPKKVLTELEKVLKPDAPETYTITIWKRDNTGGHAVTPYAVQYEGNGQYKVLIYDNNWPNDATRAIAFDTNKDTWSYDAALNPDDATEHYEGDAKTKTLELLPTSPGQSVQPCPFCGKAAKKRSAAGTTGAAPTATIYLSGSIANHSHVLVTDQAGHHLGYLNGKLVNQIPGAHYTLLTADPTWKTKLEPILYVPADVAYTISLDGSPLTAPDTESIRVIGPHWHIALNTISMHPGDKDVLTVDPKTTKLTYRTTRAQSPTIEAAVSDSRAHYAFVIAGVSSQPGSTINVSVPPEATSMVISSSGSNGSSSVDLQMTRSTDQGVQQFRHGAIPLAGGDTAELQYGNWTNPSQGIPLVTTHDGKRTTETLTSQ